MSAAIVLDDNHSVIRFYTHDSPQAIQEMLKSVKARIGYFGLHMGPLTLKFTDCVEFVTQYRDYSPPALTSTTTASTPLVTETSPTNIDRSLYTLIEQQKHTAIISVALIFIFLALFSCILCKIARIIRKKTSHRTLSENMPSVEFPMKRHVGKNREHLEEQQFNFEHDDPIQQI